MSLTVLLIRLVRKIVASPPPALGDDGSKRSGSRPVEWSATCAERCIKDFHTIPYTTLYSTIDIIKL